MNNNPNNKNLTEEDVMMKYFEDNDTFSQPSVETKSTNFEHHSIDEKTPAMRTVDLQYFHFDAKMMPLGEFYPEGTKIMIRAAQVKEIQAYSMVDDDNFYDIVEKLNDVLSSCVRVKYYNGKYGTYLDLKDGDRYYVIYLIRELTFQSNTLLTVNTPCPSCKEEVKIELRKDNFVMYEMDPKLSKYFNEYTKKFSFTLKNGSKFDLGMPTIGLQKSFTEFIINEHREKKKPNLSFLKIIPFLVSDSITLSEHDIKTKMVEFEQLKENDFLFLNDAVSKLKFGIKELKKNCECGQEVRHEQVFPDRFSALFVIPGAFDEFIQE